MTGLHGDVDLHDPELSHAADVLSRSLVRFHPSFGFEERLAARLRLAGLVPLVGDGRPAGLVTHAGAAGLTGFGPVAAGMRRLPAGPGSPIHVAVRVPRPVIVGGAIASGVSIAGAAVVAWRRLRRDA